MKVRPFFGLQTIFIIKTFPIWNSSVSVSALGKSFHMILVFFFHWFTNRANTYTSVRWQFFSVTVCAVMFWANHDHMWWNPVTIFWMHLSYDLFISLMETEIVRFLTSLFKYTFWGNKMKVLVNQKSEKFLLKITKKKYKLQRKTMTKMDALLSSCWHTTPQLLPRIRKWWNSWYLIIKIY